MWEAVLGQLHQEGKWHLESRGPLPELSATNLITLLFTVGHLWCPRIFKVFPRLRQIFRAIVQSSLSSELVCGLPSVWILHRLAIRILTAEKDPTISSVQDWEGETQTN